MRGIYASCDVLLKMSRIESFAYPPLEAMACACTVVLGEVRGGIDYAVHEENVLKVPMGDVAAARAAVLRLLGDEPLRDKLRRQGLATARRWTWEASHQAMLSVVLADGAPLLATQLAAPLAAPPAASAASAPPGPPASPVKLDSVAVPGSATGDDVSGSRRKALAVN